MKARYSLAIIFGAALAVGCDDLRDSAQRHTDPAGYQQNQDAAFSNRVAASFGAVGLDTIRATSDKISAMERTGNSVIQKGYLLKKSNDTSAAPATYTGTYVEVVSAKTVMSKGVLNISRFE